MTDSAASRRTISIGTRESAWSIAQEVPVEITLNGDPWTVLLASPGDLEDLAIGLAMTEGVLRDVSDVEAVEIASYLVDTRVNLRVRADQVDQSARRARTLVSGTACGLCGVESLAQLEARRPPHPGARLPVEDRAVLAALESLPSYQPLNAETRTVHAAAWCDLEGTVQVVREDVGRHNALDKLIGALARAARLTEPGFVLMTSRCSYELVGKAAVANTQLLATVSAPTSLALNWAETLHLPLASTLRSGDVVQVVRFPTLAAPTHGN